MTKRMLIDATHAEETRVVVMDGNRLEDFDVETSTKKQLKGNIYLAKVVRVEPSLQAAFVEYGGGRHGFLAFGEIHPDYYQIPVADRERLLRLQAEEARAEEAAEDAADAEADGRPLEPVPVAVAAVPPETGFAADALPEAAADPAVENGHGVPVPQGRADETVLDLPIAEPAPAEAAEARMPDLPPEEVPPEQGGLIDASLPDADAHRAEHGQPEASAPETGSSSADDGTSFADSSPADDQLSSASFPEAEPTSGEAENGESGHSQIESVAADATPPETVGGDHEGGEEARERRLPSRYLRNYKIQEVIRRRQIMLVQVVKEERGTKGAALTTYISLAGRFSVLMPNSPRGGGISRKITSAADRRRLKEITNELEIPDGMGLIVRTAGANRPKPEIKRDCEYLLRLWDDIRDTTLQSVAPALIHEEASLIKRAIRDNYSRDIDEVLVDGEDGWKQARDIMRMLMPAHAKKVISWRDHGASNGQPLFASQQVEAQLDAMLSPNVQLRSGGYLVIGQTEALVAIDVNSGRSTRERGIEETALRTNLEAADEVARQLRLRDLAGLIVIDFIDMESKKHNAMVERRLKEALKVDRARIQVGQISHFGLLEMSRQRLRPSLAETSFVLCPHCAGTGQVRSTESAGIHVLRAIDEEGAKRRAAEIIVHVAPVVAMYILNHKRDRLADIERRYAMQVVFEGDATLIAPEIKIDRVRPAVPVSVPEPFVAREAPPALPEPRVEEEEEPDVVSVADEDEETETEAEATAAGEEGERGRRRRRRRRRGKREDGSPAGETAIVDIDAEQPDLPGVQAAPAAVAEAAPVARMAPAADADAAVPAPVATEGEAAPVAAGAAEGGEPGDAPTGEEDGERPRRRGRRGGRRRRRDEGTDQAEGATAEAAEPPPVYAGPTPANPFGGVPFDIYDVMEQAEQMPPAIAAIAMPVPPADAATIDVAPRDVAPSEVAPAEVAPAEAPAEAHPGEVAAEAPPLEALPEPAPAETAPAESAPVEHVAAPEAAAPPETEAPAEVPAPALHLVVPEPPPAPLVKPVVIDSGAPELERKRGWWRRG